MSSRKPAERMARVVRNESRGGGYYVIRLSVTGSFPMPKGGSFLMLSCGREPEILLRRPMAFYDVRKSGSRTEFDVLYTVVGRGTKQLAQISKGAELSFLGPIGNAFSVPKAGERYAVVAGGVGIAPFLLWGKSLTSAQRKRVSVFLGFRSRPQLGIVQDFRRAKFRPLCAVEEGGGDFKGTVIDLLLNETRELPPTRVLTCGPERMMERAREVAECLAVPCEASLEARMGCGVGACLSCVTTFAKTARPGGYALVCQDGPIFVA